MLMNHSIAVYQRIQEVDQPLLNNLLFFSPCDSYLISGKQYKLSFIAPVHSFNFFMQLPGHSIHFFS